MGVFGTLVVLLQSLRRTWRETAWPLFLLFLPAVFYVWSMHSSGTPIFIPNLPPYSWYNTRYALAAVPFAAFAVGTLVTLLPARLHSRASLTLVIAVSGAWLIGGRPYSISWKESEVNSEARRAWTAQAADFLAREYRPGSGIVFPFGDLTGVLREAGIPLREGLHEGNGAAFDAAIARPDLLLREVGLVEWGLAFSGDAVDATLQKAGYVLRRQVVVKGAPVVEIYHRE